MPAKNAKSASGQPRLSAPRRGQAAFEEDLDSRLGTYLKLAEQTLMAEKARALRDFDLSVAQYATLMALYYVPEQSAAMLARTAAVTPQTMATVLSKLEAKRLVDRVHSEIHSKVLLVSLTPSGEALVLRADASARAVEQRLRDAFTESEVAVWKELLLRAASAVRDRDGE
ncbi:MarR family winged helix-turn-helix transcriptional regulator [Arthrobacter sp. RAF14]|uniref:MarR family winged helix-turn-helix transcriptional regulator n=1 Tax=Arthrobacter sp. RAF14 TaxID=3233051 RepID=UPI003F91AA18